MILRIFDYFCKHRLTRWGLLTALTMLLLLFISRLSYQEDITDFLPLGTTDREALSVYQDISGAGELIVILIILMIQTLPWKQYKLLRRNFQVVTP